MVVHCSWVKLSGTDLLPGDVISIGRSTGQSGEDKSVPADMLLLAGSAIVNEAILTGESTPQWKVRLFSLYCLFNCYIFLAVMVHTQTCFIFLFLNCN